MMRTTLTLDEDVAATLADEVRTSGRSFKDVVNEAIRDGFLLRARAAAEASGKPPFEIKARPLGLRPGLSYDNIEELLDVVEGPMRR